MDNKLRQELVTLACEQLAKGLEAKKKRMDTIVKINDLYNNKTIELVGSIMNIPFPILAGNIDTLYSKIDNAPTLDFKVPNKRSLSEKVLAAWTQESSSTRAGWKRKDRAEKKFALLSGRGVCKVYASSVNGEYRSHYEVVDIYSFVADPTRGWLEDGNYHGETDIFKTHSMLKEGVAAGVYEASEVAKIINFEQTDKDGQQQVVANKFDRLKALGVDTASTSYAGQRGVNMTEWIMRYNNTLYYLFFDPMSKVAIRAELLSEVFENNKTPYISWATHYDEYNFWSKGPADDVYPVAEAIRATLNNVIENNKRQTRPMRIVDAGALVDINELQDYVPDNVIIRNSGKDPHIVTVETPEITTSINLVEFLDGMIQNKTGVNEQGVNDASATVGVYYGKLQQEADRIGTINKEYSESYAHKGYRFFWGLKQHLSDIKQIEMLGKSGIKLHQLSQIDFKDVDDVDDVTVSGGSQEAENTAVDIKRKAEVLTQLTASYPQVLNPRWVIETSLKLVDFDDDDVARALDQETLDNREIIEAADQAIQNVLLGLDNVLYQDADTTYASRITDYARSELDWVKINSNGQEIGVNKKIYKQFNQLMQLVAAHQQIIVDNMQRKAQVDAQKQNQQMQQANAQAGGVQIPGMPQSQQQAQLAQPNEPVSGTPAGTASQSQLTTGAVAV